MALDPSLKDKMDPDVWKALEALDQRLEAAIPGDPPVEHRMTWSDGRTYVYRLVQEEDQA